MYLLNTYAPNENISKVFDCQKLFYYWSAIIKYVSEKSIVIVTHDVRKISRKACLYPRKNCKQTLHNLETCYALISSLYIFFR